ncbi:MAG: pyridoxamine 5'-phosphate oxidase family protein [Pseudomonadota bacterium]
MTHRYHALMFSPTVRAAQTALGSRQMLAEQDGEGAGETDIHHDKLTASEATFIALRDSFYMASVSETGWPYVQHRGGPTGFVKVFDPNTFGFADFAGNRQYISLGNLMRNDRVSFFFMDYANRSRLKVLGHASYVDADNMEVLNQLVVPGYRARVERGVIIKVAAYEWNCPQHITPRVVDADATTEIAGLRKRILELETKLAEKS